MVFWASVSGFADLVSFVRLRSLGVASSFSDTRLQSSENSRKRREVEEGRNDPGLDQRVFQSA